MPWWEITLVTAVFMGPFIWRSNVAALQGSASKYVAILMSNSHLFQTGAIEAAILSIFLFVLRWRGWTTADFRVRPGLVSSAQGVGLLVVVGIVHAVTIIGLFILVFALQTRYASFLQFVLTQAPHLTPHSIDLAWVVLIPVMILNAFMEELICMGYFFTQVAAKQGPLAALLLTVLLRMAYHTYQGPLNAVSIAWSSSSSGFATGGREIFGF